jgi:hypothetical protein
VTPTDAPKSASALAVAELVKALRRNGRLRTSPGQPDLDDTVIATLIEQQSARLQELERDAARYRWLKKVKANIDWYVPTITIGSAEPVFTTYDEPIDAALAADSAGGKP